MQLQEPDDVSTFNACDPSWLETSGKLWANSCEAASRKLRRFVSGRAATFLLLGVLTGAGVMTAKGQLGRAYRASIIGVCVCVCVPEGGTPSVYFRPN